jgi:hypothetical protein
MIQQIRNDKNDPKGKSTPRTRADILPFYHSHSIENLLDLLILVSSESIQDYSRTRDQAIEL